MRLVVICARPDECEAVLAGLGPTQLARLPAYPRTLVSHPGAGTVVAVCAGPGPAAGVAAGVAANRLRPDVLLSMGLARGLRSDLATGAIVVADRIVGADLGAEVGGGPGADPGAGVGLDFRALDQLGLGPSSYEVTSPFLEPVSARAATSDSPVRVGPLLSVATMPGSAEGAELLLRRHPEALAVAREGFGVAMAGAVHGIPAFEIRAISELAGTAREAERDSAALDALAQTTSALFARAWEDLPGSATG